MNIDSFQVGSGPVSFPTPSIKNVSKHLLTDAMWNITQQRENIYFEKTQSKTIDGRCRFRRHSLSGLEEVDRVKVTQVHTSLVRRRGLVAILVRVHDEQEDVASIMLLHDSQTSLIYLNESKARTDGVKHFFDQWSTFSGAGSLFRLWGSVGNYLREASVATCSSFSANENKVS